MRVWAMSRMKFCSLVSIRWLWNCLWAQCAKSWLFIVCHMKYFHMKFAQPLYFHITSCYRRRKRMVHQSQLPRTGQTTQGEGRGCTSKPPHESQEKKKEQRQKRSTGEDRRGLKGSALLFLHSEQNLRRYGWFCSAESLQMAQRFPLSQSRSECQSHAWSPSAPWVPGYWC